MVFSTIIFLLRFLPITLALYYLAPPKLKNTVLFLCSLVFYWWGATSQEFLFPTRFSISSRSSSRILRKKSHASLWGVAQTIFFLTGMMC